MKYYWVYIFLFLMVACNRPDAPDCLKTAGSFSVRNVPIQGPVREVVLNAPVFLHVRPATIEKIEIKGPKNLIEKIECTKVNKALYVRNRNTCNFVRGYRHEIHVYVYTPEVEFIRNNATGEVNIDAGVATDTLRVESEGGDIKINSNTFKLLVSSHGNGNIYFNGSAQHLFVYLFGTNFFYGENGHVASYAFVEQISVGDAYLNMNDGSLLNYKIYKKGNIFYRGNVTADGKIWGTGILKKL